MSELQLLDIAAGAMAAQRTSLEYLAQNVAAASVAGPNGYERYKPRLSYQGDIPKMTVTREHHDAEGSLCEMLAVLDAQRAYEADTTVFAAGKRIVEHTIDLERA